MKRIIAIIALALVCAIGYAQRVSIKAVDEPAAEVFRKIVEQTGMNFVYSTPLLDDVRVTINVTDAPLNKALTAMFRDTDINFKVKGKNIMLSRKPERKKRQTPAQKTVSPAVADATPVTEAPKMLAEVSVVSRLEAPAVKTSEIGAKKLTANEILNTPTLFGESDVLKALQLQPGIIAEGEGMAGMHVHGGNVDENLIMLDNVPLYQVNHFAGFFSAFNVDAIRYIDFFKSSIPAKYDGRLSSYLDVRTLDGSPDGHHGSFRLGYTSGAFSLGGPISRNTTYFVALRRSWLDLLTIPLLAIANHGENNKIRFRYAFMDLNAKVTHRFSDRATGFVSFYYGDDKVETGSKDVTDALNDYGWYEDEKFDLHWGNLVAQAGCNYRFTPAVSAEFTAAYTRFFSNMTHNFACIDRNGAEDFKSKSVTTTDNHIDDAILRADFDWRPDDASRIRYGAGYTLHRFQPASTARSFVTETSDIATRDSAWAYTAHEANAYIEDDWRISNLLRLNAGVHASVFGISGKAHCAIDPRLSVSYTHTADWAVKAAYSRTTQYVHQLCQTYLALPTDQWVPITGKFKPQTADKVTIGAYWQPASGPYALSAEAYYKSMRNLVDYRDEYYLHPPTEMWSARLCTGRGTAKGIDLKVEKTAGKLTGHISYSLAWADRTFADKNGGHTFPARFDNRHTINALLCWHVSDRVQLSAAWTGHSGNRFTFLPQVWESPDIDVWGFQDDSPLKTSINNYRLPFYHRLDLSCTVRNKRGYWNFGLYNAYCHLNTIAIRRDITDWGDPVFQKVKLLPIIPSISYTWVF